MKTDADALRAVLAGGLAILGALGGRAEGPAGAATAQVRVATDPPGAMLLFDGSVQDVTPVTITDVEAGTHLLIARKEGFSEARRTLRLEAGQRLGVDIRLDPVCGLAIVHSEPAGAEVEISGASRGTTPLLLADLPLGRYRLKLSSRGYVSKEVELALEDRTPQKVTVELISDSARLLIESRPPGARIRINGLDRGVTPQALDRIPAGETGIEVAMPGFTAYRDTLKLASGDVRELRVELRPLPGTLSIVSIPPVARVYVDNQFRGQTPLELDDLEPGRYRVRAELRGHEPVARDVEVTKGDRLVEEFRLERNSGLVELITEPAGVQVFLDGEDMGITSGGVSDVVSDPLRLEMVTAGTHSLQLTRKGYFGRKLTVTVVKDKTLTLHEKLQRRFIPDVVVRTGDGPDDYHQGVLIATHPNGDVEIETRPGIFLTIEAARIVAVEPLTTKPSE